MTIARLGIGLLSLFSLAACQKMTSAFNSGQCSSSFSQAKVQLHQTGDRGPASIQSLGDPSSVVSETLDSELPAGTKLTYLYDLACSGEGKGLRSEEVELRGSLKRSDLEREAQANPCLVGIGDHGEAKLTALPNDTRIGEQLHLPAVKLDAAYDLFFNATSGIKRDVVIAVIDSGVDINHNDLRSNVWVNSDEVAGNGMDDDNNGYIDDVNGYNFASRLPSPIPDGTWNGVQHGTHVSGLAAAAGNNMLGISGVMGKNVKIMGLNIFGTSEGATTASIDNAIRYAADNGADVINMSFGGPGQFATTQAALQYALSKGVVLIAAAGNDNQELTAANRQTPISYAMAMNGFVGVAALDTIALRRTVYSNYSSTYVELAAPGSQDSTARLGLLSTVLQNAYARLEGTSMASPVVAGAAGLAIALIRSRGYTTTPAEVETFLTTGTAVAGLAAFVKGGQTLDLVQLYNVINQKYPFTGNANPQPSPSPGSGEGSLSSKGGC